MLMQNLKTAAELGITDAEFDALYKVLGMLEREELKYMPATTGDVPPEYNNFVPEFFNMALTHTQNSCGSACCILGWARHVAGDRTLFHGRTPANSDLFRMAHDAGLSIYPGKFSNEILPDEAAIALRNYLTFGEARWAEVLVG